MFCREWEESIEDSTNELLLVAASRHFLRRLTLHVRFFGLKEKFVWIMLHCAFVN